MAYKTCGVRCVERAYVVLLILRNIVLNVCEIKSAIRAAQAYESPGGILASRLTLEVFCVLLLYLQTIHITVQRHFQSAKSVWIDFFFNLPGSH